MRPGQARFVTACQQMLALAVVLAALTPAAAVISLDVVGQGPGEAMGGRKRGSESGSRGAAVAASSPRVASEYPAAEPHDLSQSACGIGFRFSARLHYLFSSVAVSDGRRCQCLVSHGSGPTHEPAMFGSCVPSGPAPKTRRDTSRVRRRPPVPPPTLPGHPQPALAASALLPRPPPPAAPDAARPAAAAAES